MILTLQKSELLKKLEAARKAVIDAARQKNATIQADFDAELREHIASVESTLAKLKACKGVKATNRGDRYVDSFYFPTKRDPVKADTTQIDNAIQLLTMSAEDVIRVDTARDKFGLHDAIKAALG